MVSLSSVPFVSVVKIDGALQLSGEKASQPLKAGQTIAAHGTFEDQSETELGFFVVLKCSGRHHTYDLAPVGSADEYWGEHLKGSPSVVAKVKARPGEKAEKGPNGMELLTRWRIVAEPGMVPDVSVLGALGKHGADEAIKKWHFLSEYIVTDKEAGNVTPAVN